MSGGARAEFCRFGNRRQQRRRRGIAIGLGRAGWDVVVNYGRDEQGAIETATEIRSLGRTAWTMPGDVGNAAQVGAMFDRITKEIGRLDLLVNNAGVQTWAPFARTPRRDWDRTIRTNLKGTFLCTQFAARLMRDRGQGKKQWKHHQHRIGIERASVSEPDRLLREQGGIQNFTVVAAIELGPLGIRVNCVAPVVLKSNGRNSKARITPPRGRR